MKKIVITLLLIGLLFDLKSQTAITLDANDVKTTMSGRGAGFCNSFITDRPELTPNIRKTGATTLRFPMGTLGVNYLFHNNDLGYEDLAGSSPTLRPRACTTDEKFSSLDDINRETLEFNSDLLDFDEFMTMCAEVGAEPVIMLSSQGDLLEGSTITKDQLIRNAIEWVQYAEDKGYDITYWEFGNEVTFHQEKSKITSSEYVDRYLLLQREMKKINPDLKLGFGSLGFENSITIPELAKYPQFMRNLDFFVAHQYNGDTDSYEKWRNLTKDIINNEIDNRQDLIRVIKRTINLLDQLSSTYPNLLNMDYLITEHSPLRSSWAEGGQHITQSLYGFQQVMNLFLYDQRVKYTHFWVTTSPWGNRETFDGDAEAFNPLSDWEITPQGMPILLFNEFILDNLIQPVVNGLTGVYATSSSDGEQLTLLILNKDDQTVDVNISVNNYTGSTENTQWVYSGNGHEYDKNPVLRKFESVSVNNNVISASLEPISLTIVQLGASPGTGTVPSIPSTPQITVIPGLGAANDISFEAATDANFYELQRSIGDGAFETLVFLDSLELTYVETPVNSAETYNYRIRAGNEFGYSDYSPIAVVQPDMNASSTGFRLFNSQGTDVVLDGANDMISKQSNDVNAPSQEWAIQFVGEDAFKIQNLANDQFLAATSGEAVTLSADNSSDDLLWEIELISGSTYFIKSVFNGNYLAGTGQNPGTAIRTEPFLGWLRQEWTFTSTDGSDDDDSILNSIFNGGFEIGELTGDPSNWVRSTNFSDAFMQTRQGTWSPFGLTPNGNRAYGLRIRVSHPGEPFITELFKPVDGDLIMRNGFLHEVAFLAKSSAAASIGVRATWIKEDGTLGDVLADTVVVTSASDPTNWTTFSIPLLIEEQLESTGNVFLQFGFADNPVDTYIMIDDVVVNTLLAPPGNLQSSNVTRSSFDLSWNGVINGVPIAEASIYIDDSVVAVTSGNSTTLTGLTSEAPYRVRVKGEDANGNISPFSSPLFVTIPDSTVLPLLNGDFEIGGPTAPPSHWSQEMGDASAQARSGEWMSLPPHNDQAYGVSITIQNENPYNTRLYKPESGDLYLESGIPYKIEFLAKSGTSAAISVRAQWMSGSNPVLLDTVYQTIEGFPWTLFEGFLQVDEGEAGASANLMLEFGFADNPSGTNIMVDDIEIINLTSLPYIPLEIEEATILNIEEVDVSKYMMYPNPLVSGLLTLRMKSGQRSSRVIISDTMGKIILDKQCKEDSLELSRENFRSGMYLVKIITERERKIIKLMVE